MPETAIARLKKTILFQKLLEKEDLLEEYEVSKNIISVIREIAPLLERIPENMPEFTLHNANHSAKVVELMGKIIPSDTLNHLNIIELSILIYAAYLHDIGMTASRDEREEIITKNPEFAKLRIFNEELSLKFDEAKRDGDHRTATFIEDKLFTEFLRRNHVDRSHKYTKKKYGLKETPISWKGIPYYKLVQAICDGHGLPVRDLYDTKCWRRNALVGDQNVNVQYLSVILRLADILDLDPERTPRSLLDFINPKDETSIKEWKKHLSIIGCKISQEEINIEAECEHPIYERALREFVDMIETERKESILLTSRYKDDLAEKYRLDLLKPVIKENIRSNGEYIYSDFHFKLDFHRVIDLLMGERLYGDPTLTLRELLQNSVDAVRYRESMEKNEGNQFQPFIKITLKNQELIIEDNGIGMDDYVFENYFLQIGKSYYNSPECRSSGVEIDPVSEFGIGILSIFMVASSFILESRRKPLDPLNPPAPINVEIPTAYDYFVRRSSSRFEIGTKITLSLKSDHPFSPISLVEKISEIAPFIEYPIIIETSEKTETYKPYVPGEKIYDVKDTKEYFEIVFDDEIKGIKGKLRIFGSIGNSNSIFGKSKYSVFAQNGFSIPCDKLLPDNLFFNIQASINLSGQSKLSLSPNRLDIVKDERYEKLIDIIQSGIMQAYEKYLITLRDSVTTTEYVEIVNKLLEMNIHSFPDKHRIGGGFVYKKKEVRKFIEYLFLNYAPLLTISDDGQRIYKMMKDLNKFNLAIVGINDWEEKIPDAVILKETKHFVGEETVLLMDEEKGSFPRYYFLDKILGNFSDIYITSIPGLVIMSFSDQVGEGTFSLCYNTNFTYRMHGDQIEKEPLFVHPPNISPEDPDMFGDVVYNAHHPLLAKLLSYNKPKDEISSEALKLLIYQIDKCLQHLWERVDSQSLKRNHRFRESANINYVLVGILKYYPQIFKEFYEAMEEYWEEAKNIGAISLDEEFIGFSVDDLPWFWNCELSDIKLE
ncbi:chaperone protein [Methanosarcina sp. MSH10X1]|uniref:HD domain-containing protein n=1 Tax=Methanosarcina sp. MSH10X1 TaxID=2507075 RepID=UPI000FFC8F7A|nr:ATP-binding protein [Methanosarcina sp. MSH10X1]RXA19455.1 chaperone protein [Methanosarcina sp. MSH10X1]